MVLDLRLYRVTLLPFAVLLIVAAFSLHAPPGTPATAPPAQTFDATTAASVMSSACRRLSATARPGRPATTRWRPRWRARARRYTLADPGVSVRVVSSSVETTAGRRHGAQPCSQAAQAPPAAPESP